MRKTYVQIMKQIEVLKDEAAALREAEIDGVKARIREAIEFYGLTAADLGLGSARMNKAGASRSGPALKGRKSGKLSQAVKYRNDSGGAWVGRGKRPQWLRDALEAGKSLEDFLVK